MRGKMKGRSMQRKRRGMMVRREIRREIWRRIEQVR